MSLLNFRCWLVWSCVAAALMPLAQAADEATGLPSFESAASSASNADTDDKRSPSNTKMRNLRPFDSPSPLPERLGGGLDGMRRNDPYDTSNGLLDEKNRTLTPLPPEPSSEFQKFVQTATGRQLPIFGARFFAQAADRLLGPDNVPVNADYVVGAGDEMNVRAWGSIDADLRAVVNRNGQISLPRVGTFTVAGVKAADLEKHLRAQIGRLFTNFHLNVTLGQLRGVKVFVVGPARLPGVYNLSSQATLLSAVVAARGPNQSGSMRRVLLRRNGRIISELDIYDFLVQGDKSKDLQLASGDVVIFQPKGPRIALNGALDNLGIYELKTPQESVSQVLAYAGGAPVLSNPHRAQVERIDSSTPNQAARLVEGFALDAQGQQKTLRDGDILTLLPISPQFANAVTLKGHVAHPMRYAFKPGMRIRDLIPDKEALVSPDFYKRKNLLVQVQPLDDEETSTNYDKYPTNEPRERRRARQLDYTTKDQEQTNLPKEGIRSAARSPSEPNRSEVERKKKLPTSLFDELNWEYAVIERLNPNDLSTQIIPFNLGKAVLQNDETHNRELLSGDVVTVYSQKDIRVPAGRQIRLVTLEGEVNAPGVYQTQAGETLPQLILRAGGLTREAYVYGLEFSREETRQRQRENIAEAITRLEALSSAQTARDAANKQVDSRDGTSVASAAATQAQISRLTSLQPNGRIALELSPEASSESALPALPLENLDRIVVPSRPGFVTVAGAVLSNNALLWRADRTVAHYIALAGLEEAAEPAHMFVLRADGTVITNTQRSGFLGMGGLKSMKLSPGDTVVIPNRLDYENWGHALVRNLKDWSQILSQFGLGAAAIQTLRRN